MAVFYYYLNEYVWVYVFSMTFTIEIKIYSVFNMKSSGIYATL